MILKKAPIDGCGNGGTIFIAGNYVVRDLCSRAKKKLVLARVFVKEGHDYTHGYLSR